MLCTKALIFGDLYTNLLLTKPEIDMIDNKSLQKIQVIILLSTNLIYVELWWELWHYYTIMLLLLSYCVIPLIVFLSNIVIWYNCTYWVFQNNQKWHEQWDRIGFIIL